MHFSHLHHCWKKQPDQLIMVCWFKLRFCESWVIMGCWFSWLDQFRLVITAGC